MPSCNRGVVEVDNLDLVLDASGLTADHERRRWPVALVEDKSDVHPVEAALLRYFSNVDMRCEQAQTLAPERRPE